jgi:4-oxalocrotonate tautomerase
MPIIRVEMLMGRSREQKRELVRELTDAFVRTCGGKPDALQIVIQDVDKQDWGAGGRLLADTYPDKA